MTYALVSAINLIVQVLSILILVEVIGSWLLAANVRLPEPIFRILAGISSITAVLLNPIRRVVPNMGGLDLSPIIALLLLDVLRRVLVGALVR